MELYGHVDSSRTPEEDQTTDAKQCFFFMHDVAKSNRFIVDQTNTTYKQWFSNEHLIWAVDWRIKTEWSLKTHGQASK